MDTYLYAAEMREVYNAIDKTTINIPVPEGERHNFGKNYNLLEWLSRKLGFDIKGYTYYIIHKELINELRNDCADIIADFNKLRVLRGEPQITKTFIKKFQKKFPTNNWNKEDFVGWDSDNFRPITKPHEFNLCDYYDIEKIYDVSEFYTDDFYFIFIEN